MQILESLVKRYCLKSKNKMKLFRERVWKWKIMSAGNEPWGRRRKTSKEKELSEAGGKEE